jgi:hypothetical protein
MKFQKSLNGQRDLWKNTKKSEIFKIRCRGNIKTATCNARVSGLQITAFLWKDLRYISTLLLIKLGHAVG